MEYKTVKSLGSAEIVEKRSRFISTVTPVENEQAALDFIADIKQRYWDAKHNVFAYILRNSNIKRYSDDNEPHSTAGLPTLGVLEKSGLTDCAIVTTRYFGGVLLGTGGLVRAYSAAAKSAVETVGIVAVKECSICRILCDYNLYGKIESMLRENNIAVEKAEFLQDVSLTVCIPSGDTEAVREKLIDLSFGKTDLSVIGKKFAKFDV